MNQQQKQPVDELAKRRREKEIAKRKKIFDKLLEHAKKLPW